MDISDKKTLTGGEELVVILAPAVDVKIQLDGVPSIDGNARHPLSDEFSPENFRLEELFGSHPLSPPNPAFAPYLDTSRFFRVAAPVDALPTMASRLKAFDVVVAAYLKPAVDLPSLNDMPPAAEEPPSVTPDFTAHQVYLAPSPGGIDAIFAWTLPGGSGADVKIVDIEGAWNLTHEKLTHKGGLVGGSPQPGVSWRNHGTAVMGVIGADKNGFGITGIAPEANLRTIAAFKNENGRVASNSAGAIAVATSFLGAGDILLIELHRPGPRHGFADSSDQSGYIPIEWWPDDFVAIRAAVNKGIIVVEAGGNGGENLDDPLYDAPPSLLPFGPFPDWWKNPFRRMSMDSGAVLVGAGAPPPGTHGRDYGPDRSRMPFSNFGLMMDAQGWGREVTTAGYGDKQGGLNENLWYTDLFAGTSSASPMIVGSLACVNGILRRQQAPLLTPASARSVLRETGSPQNAALSYPITERIGNRPDLRQLINALSISSDTPSSKSSETTRPDITIKETKAIKISRKVEDVREILITRYRK